MLSRIFDENRSIFSLFLFSILFLSLAACEAVEESADGDSGDTDTDTVGDGDGSTGGTGGEVDVSNIDAFGIRATSENSDYTLYLSKDGDGTTPCEPTDDDKIITCEINVDELNLYFFGLSFTAVAPQSQCEFIEYRPYYYSVAPIDGTTPNRVVYAVDGSGVLEDPADGGNANFPADPAAIAGAGGTADIYYRLGATWFSHAQLYNNAATEADDLRCPWDYSEVGSVAEGENCCIGSYGLFVDDNGEIELNQREDWGGTYSSCFRGAQTDAGIDLENESSGVIIKYNVPADGLAEEFTYTKPSELEAANEIVHIANWHSSTTYAGFPVPLLDGNPYYQFLCLNENSEVQYKINLQVREWNTEGELEEFASGDSNVGGNEDPPFASYLNDDYPGWDRIEADTVGLNISDFELNPTVIRDYLDNVDATNDTTVEFLGFDGVSEGSPIITDQNDDP